MVICTIMRMLDGICVRMLETKKFENAVTSVSARHIVTVVFRLLVTASAEQIPIICRAIGLLSKIGPNSSSLAFIFSAIAHLLASGGCRLTLCVSSGGRCRISTQFVQVRAKTILAHPETHQVVDAIGGQRRASKAIDLVLGTTGAIVDGALDHLDGQLVLFVEQLLALPDRFPLRVIHFATEARGFGMLVETETGDGIGIRLQCDKAVQRRPQAIAMDRQDDLAQGALLVTGQVNFSHFRLALDAGDIDATVQANALRRVLGGLALLVAVRHLDIVATFQLDKTTLDIVEGRRHIHALLIQSRRSKNLHLLVEQFVLFLHRTQHHRGGGDNDRAHQAHQQCDSQGSQYGIMFCGHQATPPLRRRRRLMLACMTKWSISGAHRLPNRIASMMPSGKAGLTTRINTVIAPMMIPNTHLPVLVIDADTGSVAMYTRPKARPPMVRCQYQGMA